MAVIVGHLDRLTVTNTERTEDEGTVVLEIIWHDNALNYFVDGGNADIYAGMITEAERIAGAVFAPDTLEFE